LTTSSHYEVSSKEIRYI